MLKASPTPTTNGKSGHAQHQERQSGWLRYGGDRAPEVEVRAVGLEHDGTGRKETSDAVQVLTGPTGKSEGLDERRDPIHRRQRDRPQEGAEDRVTAAEIPIEQTVEDIARRDIDPEFPAPPCAAGCAEVVF